MALVYYLLFTLLQVVIFSIPSQSIIKDIFFAKSFNLYLNSATNAPTNTSQGTLTFDNWNFQAASNPNSNNLVLGIQTININSQNMTLSFSLQEIMVYHTYFTLNVWTLAGDSVIGQSLTIRCLFIDYQASISYYSEIPNYFVIQQETFQIVKPPGLSFIQPLVTTQSVLFKQYSTTGLLANNFQFCIFITTLVVQDNSGPFLISTYSMNASIINDTYFQFYLSRSYYIDIDYLKIKFLIVDATKINSIGNFNTIISTLQISNSQINVQSISIDYPLQYLSSGKSLNLLLGLNKVYGGQIIFQTFWNPLTQTNFQILIYLNSSCLNCTFTFNYVRVLKNRCNQINLSGYPYYYSTTNMCYHKCPLSTFLNQLTLECQDCAITNCLQCRNSSFCVRCNYPIFRVDPLNPSQCIRLCNDDACLNCLINDQNYCLKCDSSLGKNNVNGVCLPICGDGIKDLIQQCDDSNTISFDGCSDVCQIQQNFQCFGVQLLNTNLFQSHCIYTQQVKMKLKIIKKLKFQNKIEMQFDIDHYWSQYQSFIKNQLISTAFQFGFSVNKQTIVFYVTQYQDNSYLGIFTIQYLESIQNLSILLKFTPPLTNLTIFSFESPENTMTVPPHINILSRIQNQGNYSLEQFSKTAKYLYEYTPSSTIQIYMKSSNNNFMYLYSQSQNKLAATIYILAEIQSVICYLIFLLAYFYGKTISIDLIIVMQLVFITIITCRQLSATYAGLALQGSINFLGFNIADKTQVIYQQGDANLRGLSLSLNPNVNLNIMTIFLIIPTIFSFLIFIIRCFWKTKKNLLIKISIISIGQLTLFGLLSISVVGNTTTAISIKQLFDNQPIELSALDISILLCFNAFQLVYFFFLCKKPSFFGQFIRQTLKFDKSQYFYNIIQLLIILNTYISVFCIGNILQKYASLVTSMSFLCISLYFILKQPFIHKKSNHRASLTYSLGSFLCLGIYLQNQLEHSMLYHYWPLVIVIIFFLIEVYSGVFLFIFIKRGTNLLHDWVENYHQYSKIDYRSIQNQQFQKKYFPNMNQQINAQNVKSQINTIDNEFEWQNYLNLAKERYKLQQKDNILFNMQQIDQFESIESNKQFESIKSNKQNNQLQNESQEINIQEFNSNKISEDIVYKQKHQYEYEYQNFPSASKVLNYKKQINQALKAFQNSQKKNSKNQYL